MRLSELKKGFWGYQKESVYRYIAQLEEEASKKLAEQDALAARERKLAEERIKELEATIKELCRENDTLRRRQRPAPDTGGELAEQRQQPGPEGETPGKPSERRGKNTWNRGNAGNRRGYRNKDHYRKRGNSIGKENDPGRERNEIREEAQDTDRGNSV